MALFLFVIIVAIALGLVGAVVKGLFYLLIIGVVLFLADLVFGGIRMGRRKGCPPRPLKASSLADEVREFFRPSTRKQEPVMIVLGIILLLIGFLAHIRWKYEK